MNQKEREFLAGVFVIGFSMLAVAIAVAIAAYARTL